MNFVWEYKMGRLGYVVQCLNCEYEFFLHQSNVIPNHTIYDMMNKHICKWCNNEAAPKKQIKCKSCDDWREVMKLVMKRYDISYDIISEMFKEVQTTTVTKVGNI